MDVISYRKALQAKRAIQKLNNRLGVSYPQTNEDIRGKFNTAKERIEELEKNDTPEFNDRLSRVAAHTRINLNKHNLKVRSLLNQTRYKLKNMIVDNFMDDFGVDKVLSTNYEYDSDRYMIKVSANSDQANIVTVKENTEIIPSYIVVSQSIKSLSALDNELQKERLYVSRDDGDTWKEIESDELTGLKDLPENNQLRIKITLESGQELYGLSYAWI